MEITENELDNLTLNEIRSHYEIICRALQIGGERYVEQKASRSHTDDTKTEWAEMAITEWLQQAEDELELVYIKGETLIQ